MTDIVDSTDRRSTDYVHFALIFLGLLSGAAGIVMTSPGIAFVGALLVSAGVFYFLME